MNILLTSLNAKFIHSSLSIHALKSYCEDFKENITIEEYTINNNEDFIISKIFKHEPTIIGFSCYIWNINETLSICSTLKKILPNTTIILGGPEVSYNPEHFIEKSYIDIVVIGEGEAPFKKILLNLTAKKPLSNIKGIAYKENNNIIIDKTIEKVDLCKIPFVYSQLTDFENKIIYYESSRGCPYMCQYCLSSVESGIRFLDINRVYLDLKFFLDNNVKQVKFVDRTFNADKIHAIKIWQYLINNDNGKTNFHFEISGDIINDEMLKVLKKARSGLFQFEIGVQSTNSKTLKEIQRYANTFQLFENIKKIKALENIHIHLDLIAGLPYENFASFKTSFDSVYALHPEQLQLGFLKLLQGSGLRLNADKYNIIYKDSAPYEVLSTNDLPFSHILILKGIEEMLEKFYNSCQFFATLKYLETLYSSPFQLYLKIWNFFEEKGYTDLSHKKIFYYTFLHDFGKTFHFENAFIIKELLRFDIFSLENAKNIPADLNFNLSLDVKGKWFDIYENENIFGNHFAQNITKKQIIRNTHIDYFSFNPICFINNSIIDNKPTTILFDYYLLAENGVSIGKSLCLKIESGNRYEQKN